MAHRRNYRDAFFANIGLCLIFSVPARGHAPLEVRVGEPLEAAVLRGLNGPARSLASFRGRPLIINVWASWCGPCRAEMASLERLAWLDRRQPFAIIGVSTDDDAMLAINLLRTTHATISHFIDHNLEMERMLGASRLPLTVFVDARGRVVRKIYGSQQWDSEASRRLIEQSFSH